MFLDVGANIGMHTLYAAKLGYPVWAAEPQIEDIIKVCFDNRISNCTNYIYIKKYQTYPMKIVHNNALHINHIFSSRFFEWNHNVTVLPNVTHVFFFLF